MVYKSDFTDVIFHSFSVLFLVPIPSAYYAQKPLHLFSICRVASSLNSLFHFAVNLSHHLPPSAYYAFSLLSRLRLPFFQLSNRYSPLARSAGSTLCTIFYHPIPLCSATPAPLTFVGLSLHGTPIHSYWTCRHVSNTHVRWACF